MMGSSIGDYLSQTCVLTYAWALPDAKREKRIMLASFHLSGRFGRNIDVEKYWLMVRKESARLENAYVIVNDIRRSERVVDRAVWLDRLVRFICV